MIVKNEININRKTIRCEKYCRCVKHKNKKEGYFEGNGYIITWAFGHLLELYDAKDYDPKMTKWRMEYFPFIPQKFQYKVKTDPKNKEKEDFGAKSDWKLSNS